MFTFQQKASIFDELGGGITCVCRGRASGDSGRHIRASKEANTAIPGPVLVLLPQRIFGVQILVDRSGRYLCCLNPIFSTLWLFSGSAVKRNPQIRHLVDCSRKRLFAYHYQRRLLALSRGR